MLLQRQQPIAAIQRVAQPAAGVYLLVQLTALARISQQHALPALRCAVVAGAAGAVLKWCPKDNPVRSLLGTLKSTVQATPLQVYPVHVTQDGSIWTKLVQ
jgi:hypothetical protein